MRAAPHLHPVHPALAHFPLAFWIGSSVSDLIALTTGAPAWWTVSHHAVAAGVITAALALIAGLIELKLRKLPRAAIVWVTVHASFMLTALVIFMVSLGWRSTMPPPLAAVALSFAGSASVIAGAFCGGTLVYRFGVGVACRADASQ